MSEVRGIEGLRPRAVYGAALTVGRKGPKGNPIDKDKFYLVSPQERDGVRPMLPEFAKYNSADEKWRKIIYGNLVSARIEDAWEYNLKAQVGKGGAHPQKRPFCVGDGSRAVRWLGGDADNFADIECPHDKCEYRQQGPKGPACKPWMRFAFRLRWPNSPLPTPYCKFTSGSWNTVSNFLGFFDAFRSAALELTGYEDVGLLGLPFSLSLTERTNRERKSKFPVVVITPEVDPMTWLSTYADRVAQMRASLGGVHPPALTDASEQHPQVIADDYMSVTPGLPVTVEHAE